jgi:hypothetical protein
MAYELPDWDGKPTTLQLGFPVFRGEGAKFHVVGKDEGCIGWFDPDKDVYHKPCKDKSGNVRKDHQLHVRSMFIPAPPGTTNSQGDRITGWWVGPEGEHVQDLFTGGFILNSPQYNERVRQIHDIDATRGTYGTKDKPEGWPELVAMDAPMLRAMLRRARQPMDAVEGSRVENRAVTQEVAVLKAALKLLAVENNPALQALIRGK